MIMERIIAHLERILDQVSDPETLDDEALERLSGTWNRLVLELEEAIQSRRDPQEGSALKGRLKRVIERMPEVHARMHDYRSEIALQLAAENRRLNAMRRAMKGMTDTSSLTYNKV